MLLKNFLTLTLTLLLSTISQAQVDKYTHTANVVSSTNTLLQGFIVELETKHSNSKVINFTTYASNINNMRINSYMDSTVGTSISTRVSYEYSSTYYPDVEFTIYADKRKDVTTIKEHSGGSSAIKIRHIKYIKKVETDLPSNYEQTLIMYLEAICETKNSYYVDEEAGVKYQLRLTNDKTILIAQTI